MKTSASLFTGGGLFDIGAMEAGYKPIWGNELDDKIAAVARLNGLPVITADARSVNFEKLERPDHLHASPPCPNFSAAKHGAQETETDLQLARAVVRTIGHFNPDTFTLENVPAYVHSQSFKMILDCLLKLGYFVDVRNLNAADFGVPQTRLRLWVRASKRLLSGYPAPMKWVGWYEVIEDLIPSLPDTQFAPWQMARLPQEYKDFLIGQGTRSVELEKHEPAQTITANSNQGGIKAFIFPGSGNTNISEATPGKGVRYADEPVTTVAAGGGGRIPMAFILSGGNAGTRGSKITLRNGDEPHHTVTASFDKSLSRGYVGGRVVKMNVQALGRFQTVPDWYRGLTVKINGNGIPCKLATAVLKTFGD
jgi:DNA (cytosine-5)-methyltransferase 1